MATEVSTDLADKLLDHIYGGTPYVAPATTYLALYENDPGPTDSGTEASFQNYVRVAITWGSVSARQIANSANVTFPAAGATGTPVTITHVAIFDALSGGNLMTFTPLNTSVSVTNGFAFELEIGNLIADFPL